MFINFNLGTLWSTWEYCIFPRSQLLGSFGARSSWVWQSISHTQWLVIECFRESTHSGLKDFMHHVYSWMWVLKGFQAYWVRDSRVELGLILGSRYRLWVSCCIFYTLFAAKKKKNFTHVVSYYYHSMYLRAHGVRYDMATSYLLANRLSIRVKATGTILR